MLSKEQINAISAAYLEVVTEKNTMVCKDCGDECGKPTNEECPHDCMDKTGDNWVAKSTTEAVKADDDTVRMIKDNPKMKNTILKKLDPKARKAVMKALKADDEDPSDDDSMDEAMDPVNKDELKGKHKDRKDKDVDNDGDVDSTDKYLHKRRKAISKSIDDDTNEGKRGFIAAAKAAKEKGEKEFVFAGKRYPCKEYNDTEIDEIVGAVAGAARVAKSAATAAGKGVKRVAKAAADIVTPDNESKKESYTFDELVDMDDEALDEIMERMDRKEVDEIVGTVARGIGRIAKKTVNRFSTSGRADAAQNKLAKMKKKAADKDRLAKAKAGIAQMKAKKKPAPTAAPKKESTMKTFKQVREDAAHTKGATKPEGINDKEGKKSKEFRDKHSVDTNDTEEKGHKDAADAGRKGPNGKKRAGDNPKGDKNIINKPTETK